jgi:hypothetical protein
MRRHLQEIASQPGSMADITSGGAERRAFRLGSMAMAFTRGKKGILTSVATSRSGAATRHRGGRGSRGRRRSRLVRLLPRAAPVFTTNGSPAGGFSPPSFSSSTYSYGGRRGTAGVAPLGWLGFGAPGRRGGGSYIGRRGAGHADGQDARGGGSGARRDSEATAGVPRFGFGRQLKGKDGG